MISKNLLITLLLVTGISSVILINRLIDVPVLQTTVAMEEQGTKQIHSQAINQIYTSSEYREFIDAETEIDTSNRFDSVMQDEPLQETETIELINSPQTTERVAVIEFLGANPNQASETLLTHQLVTDSEASVRNAAARSLGIIDAPTDATIQALLVALEDESESVRLSALSTLQLYILQEDTYSEKASALKFQLETKALSNHVSKDIKQAITEILEAGWIVIQSLFLWPVTFRVIDTYIAGRGTADIKPFFLTELFI